MVLYFLIQIYPLVAGIMDANANPDAPANINRSSSNAVDTTIDLANTVITVVKEVGEILNSVPYVKSLSGVILQIIQVRDVRSLAFAIMEAF